MKRDAEGLMYGFLHRLETNSQFVANATELLSFLSYSKGIEKDPYSSERR